MKVLWAPWRMELISGPKEPGCIFCDYPRHSDRRRRLVLRADRSAVVMLNKYPYNSGHLMVAPRRHVGDLHALTRAEYLGLAESLRRAAAIVERHFRPDGVNVGANFGQVAGAGIADHLHWHVVPRWSGDTNFMPVIGAAKVIPEHLLDTYDLLRPRFRRRPRG